MDQRLSLICAVKRARLELAKAELALAEHNLRVGGGNGVGGGGIGLGGGGMAVGGGGIGLGGGGIQLGGGGMPDEVEVSDSLGTGSTEGGEDDGGEGESEAEEKEVKTGRIITLAVAPVSREEWVFRAIEAIQLQGGRAARGAKSKQISAGDILAFYAAERVEGRPAPPTSGFAERSVERCLRSIPLGERSRSRVRSAADSLTPAEADENARRLTVSSARQGWGGP